MECVLAKMVMLLRTSGTKFLSHIIIGVGWPLATHDIVIVLPAMEAVPLGWYVNVDGTNKKE